MRTARHYQKVIVIAILSGIVILQSIDAYAAWTHWSRSSREMYHNPRAVRMVPRPYRGVIVTGLTYYYHQGMFYRPGPSGYVIVRAPLGAVVPDLPPLCQTVYINDETYYTTDTVYYTKAPGGYTVVTQPIVITAESEYQNTHPSNKDTVIIHIPNRNDSYTPVVLQKTKKGYIGPQGELYPEYPTVAQLEVLYAR
jgi:hypothetical protein